MNSPGARAAVLLDSERVTGRPHFSSHFYSLFFAFLSQYNIHVCCVEWNEKPS